MKPLSLKSLLIITSMSLATYQQVIAETKSCNSIFSKVSVAPEKFYEKKSFQEKLKKLNYKIADDADFGDLALYKKIENEWVLLGYPTEIQAPLGFHWSPKSDHDRWIKGKGVSKTEMDDLLEAPGQTLGKGFYISTHPVDSRIYGDFLTIFQLQRPLRQLTIGGGGGVAGNDASILRELREIGFDTLGSNHYVNWLSLFNANVLSIAKEIDHDSFQYILEHYRDDYNTAKMPVEEDLSVVFRDKQSTLTETAFARSVLSKVQRGESLDSTEKAFYQLLVQSKAVPRS